MTTPPVPEPQEPSERPEPSEHGESPSPEPTPEQPEQPPQGSDKPADATPEPPAQPPSSPVQPSEPPEPATQIPPYPEPGQRYPGADQQYPPPPPLPPDGYGPYGAPPVRPNNNMGVAALVLGIVAFLIGPCSILAIVFGRIGLNRVAKGEATNRGVAQAGLVIGIITLVMWIMGLILVARQQ